MNLYNCPLIVIKHIKIFLSFIWITTCKININQTSFYFLQKINLFYLESLKLKNSLLNSFTALKIHLNTNTNNWNGQYQIGIHKEQKRSMLKTLLSKSTSIVVR